MIVKSLKDSDFEIILQQSDGSHFYSVTLLKNDRQAEFHGNLDFDSALEVYDFFFDKVKGNDLKDWGIK